jgi:aminoglycoside phosphotransferase (APT) family kinase protein
MRVLAALGGTDVPHPRLIAACPDEGVLDGAVFFLMEHVEGFNAAQKIPPLHTGAESLRYLMGLAMVDALASLGAVDHTTLGLTDFGRPEGFLDRQVDRWLAELDTYGRFSGYPGPAIPELSAVAAWLQRNPPKSWVPGLMHGDFHLGNVLFALEGPGVMAIVDWEMCTVGDPLLDLGWMLATWPQDGEDNDILDSALARAGGLARRDDLIARYESRTSRDVGHIGWYVVLACFKLGILLEGTYARSRAGKAPVDVGERLHKLAVRLFDRAAHQIASC